MAKRKTPHEMQAEQPEYPHPTTLTDREWALIQDLFDRIDAEGTPSDPERRLMVDACRYVIRTGCPWQMLPEDFPPWQDVHRTFQHWSTQGKFEQMHDRLFTMWQDLADRKRQSTTAASDAEDGA